MEDREKTVSDGINIVKFGFALSAFIAICNIVVPAYWRWVDNSSGLIQNILFLLALVGILTSLMWCTYVGLRSLWRIASWLFVVEVPVRPEESS